VAIDREKILALAQKYVEKKRYDKAVIEYQKVIQEDPNDARTLLKIGDLQSKMEEYASAVATYERVGRFYAAQGFSLKAIAVYKQIREIISKHVPQLEEKYAHVTPKLAELYQQLGLTSDALAALDDVATRLQRQGREQEAIEIFRKICELDPTNPLPHLRLAEALLRGKDVDGAVIEFSIAAEQLAKAGRRDDALKVLERLLQHKADPMQARKGAELYLARSSPNDGLQALAKLQICFQANPRDLDTLALLARAFNHIGQAAKAVEVQKEMARIARDTGREDLFEELIGRLLKLVPNDEAVRQLAMSPRPASSMPPSMQQPEHIEHPGRVAPAAVPPTAWRRGAGRDVREGVIEGAPPADDPEELDSDAYQDVADGEIAEVEPGFDLTHLTQAGDLPGDDTDVVVVETDVVRRELADDARAVAAQALSDAASFRRARLPTKAIATLRAGAAAVPSAIELREMLRDLLLETGQTKDAADEMLAIAELQIEALDAEQAVRTLQDVLLLEPDSSRASEMLRALGYELVEEQAPSSTMKTAEHGALPEDTERERYDREHAADPRSHAIADPHTPLGAYNLDEIDEPDMMLAASEPSIRIARMAPPDRTAHPANAANAAHAEVDRGGRRAAGPRLEEIDDPFAEAPLPSFPLEGPTQIDSSRAPIDSSQRPSRRGVVELESALEEAEFFASRGLCDDARTILDEQLLRLPNHPLVLERLAELDAQERGEPGGSGTRPAPVAGGLEDRAFDIAESLGALEAERPSAPDTGPSSGGATEQQVDVEEVFAKFKEGVAKQIGADDAQSHYDLGVAYQAMALTDDAIREFETAARDPRRACVCHSMIGMIHLERGNINEAIESLLRGLEAPDRTKDQEAALSYELGAAYEAKKMNKQGLEHFQHAARLIPGYRDVSERIRRLQKVEPKPQSRAVAVGADDEFDRAFEDILGKEVR
jgi:tetratricopeptide (TPR) repeat protein